MAATTAKEVIIMVDPCSTGGNVAYEAYRMGYAVVACWCTEATPDMKFNVPDCVKEFSYYAVIDEQDTIAATAAAVRKAAEPMRIAAVIVGGETGVTLADKLSVELGVRTNGVLSTGDRRNKSVQQQVVKAAGLRAVREALGTRWTEVEAFCEKEPMPVVVKPVESAGSDGVKLCKSKAEAQAHFNLLMESQRKCGSQGAAVLVQEFLKGKEYVVDHVSRDGVHKTVMCWVYDKRPANGSAFVYYGMLPVDSGSKEAQLIIPYVRGVLDALKIKNGPTHGEVMMTSTGPCLVEMNCRSMGADGVWMPLSRALTGGYSQPEAAVWSHVNQAEFDKLPDRHCSPFKAAGQTVFLVSYSSGTVRATPGFDTIRKLPSFVALHTGVGVGSRVELTVDLFTNVGYCVFAHKDKTQLEKDIEVIRKMEKAGLFEYDEEIDPAQLEDVSAGDMGREFSVGAGRRARSHSELTTAMGRELSVGAGRRVRSHSELTTALASKPASKGQPFALGLLIGMSIGMLAGIAIGKKLK